MRILQVHNEYQHLGGEEVVVTSEYQMLKQYGHSIEQWIVKNLNLDRVSLSEKTQIALQSVWSIRASQQIKQRLKEFQPDVVHVHNTVPKISPSIYEACRSFGIPVVQTLHNYRLICPGYYLYRNNRVCEDCINKSFRYPAIVHGCYRNNSFQSAVAVAGLTIHQLKRTYSRNVDIYIALTDFARQKFIAGGLPSEKIAVKPNFVSSNILTGSHKGGYALFVGKLVKYKGIETLLQAWRSLNEPIPLKVVGQGPLEILLKSNLPSSVEYLGQQPREEVLKLMQDATLIIFPSEWYEGFPMTIAEAFATGSPVVASRIGAASEIVRDGRSGWHFEPGNAENLAQVVQQAWSDSQELSRRGALARKQYDELYSIEKNYLMTMKLYQTAIEWFNERSRLTVF